MKKPVCIPAFLLPVVSRFFLTCPSVFGIPHGMGIRSPRKGAVRIAMISSSHQTAVVQLYLSVLNRLPDTRDLALWTGRLEEGRPLVAVIETFLEQADTAAIYPVVDDSAAFVTAYYQTVLCREPDAAGLAFWSEVLTQAGGSESAAARARFIAEIGEVVSTPLVERPAYLSEQAYTLTVGDRTLFTGKLAVGLRYADGAAGDASQAMAELAALSCGCAAKGDATVPALPPAVPPVMPLVPPAAPMHFVLTTGVDRFTGDTGADTFDATHLTFNLTDALDGGAGIDTFTYVDTSSTGVALPAAQVKDIEIIQVSNRNTGTDARATVVVDAANFVGATAFDSYLSTKETDFVGLAAGQQFGMTGDGVAVNGRVAGTYVAGVTAASVTVAGGTIGRIIDVEGADLAVVSIRSAGAANSLGGLNLADSATTLKISADTSLTLGRARADGLQTLSVEGTAAVVNLGSFDARGLSLIDASGLTLGGIRVAITAGGSNPVTILGGERADDIITGSAGGFVTGGSGKDSFHVGNGFVVGTGAGGEVVQSDMMASLLTISDFELGDVLGFVGTATPGRLTGTGVTTLDLSSANFLLDAVNSAAFIVNDSGTSGTVEAFRFGGDTYLLADLGAGNARSFGTGDILVKLSGVVATNLMGVSANNEVFYGGVII
jgi:hypothetical protein